MEIISDQSLEVLQKTTPFENVSSLNFSRMVPYLNEVKLNEGDTLYISGMPATEVFYILEGEVRLISEKTAFQYFSSELNKKVKVTGSPVHDKVSGGFIGEETILGDDVYHLTAVIDKPTRVIAIPHDILERIINQEISVRTQLEKSLLNHFTHKHIISSEDEKPAVKPIPLTRIIGWIFVIVIPSLILFLSSSYAESYGFYKLDLSWNERYFIVILSATILMWIFSLAHEFVPSIFAILSILILGISPPEVALSGFTAGSFFMALSIFGLAVVLASSGFTYRAVLYVLRIVPKSQFWYGLSVMITGIFVTPLFPSANGRITLFTPLLIDMKESLGYRSKGGAITRLSVAAFSGFTLFSGIFLSSKSINFVVYGLFPPQIRDQFSWTYWTFASLIAGLVLIVFSFLLMGILFKNKETPRLTVDQVKTQIRVLGPMNASEWAALGSIVIFFIGIITSSIHKIKLPWIGMAILYFVLALQFLSKKDFQKSIDWSFLIYLGTLIGLVKTISFVGIDKKIISLFSSDSYFSWIAHYLKEDIYIFALILSGLIFILRIFLPNNAAVVILASVFLPVSEIYGVNPWVVGFIILFMSDSWIMPYQCTYYTLFQDLSEGHELFDIKSFVLYHIFINGVRIIAILCSIPFWQWLGIL